ncbi:GAF domain-containing protein [Trichocoleus sp. FACHB-262]|uniref:sensor histidine kinase n=1 Tax=Trichocoleus sp. FACHB-262 TaxID=2692869 RepID=UPI0016846015|nr:GAF domain-containing protein [Trichocoleus sp. FACHB-262]MBD2122124.1 GAF domain-containing protein [Trichocoleus sp. FACHB-262]
MELHSFEQRMETIQERISSLAQFAEQLSADQAAILKTSLDELSSLTKALPIPSNNDISSNNQDAQFLTYQSEEKLSKIFQASPIAISISTITEGRFIDVNNSFVDLVGYSREELINHTVLELAIWPSAEDRKRLIELINRQGLVRSLEAKYAKKSGEMRDALVSVDVLEIDGERCALAFLNDITERKQAETQLQQLYQQTQYQVQRERALNRFTQAVRNSLDIDCIFATAAQEIGQMLQIDYVSILQYVPQRQIWLNVAEYEQQLGLVPTGVGMEIPDADNPLAARLKQLEVVRIDNTQVLNDPINSSLAEEFPGAWLLIPLQYQGSLWGSLTLSQRDSPHTWQDSEVDLGCAIADQLALAIQQSELYQQVQQLNANLEQQVQERTQQLQRALSFESLLKRITDKVRDSLDEGQILQTAVQELGLGLQVKRCETALHDLAQQTSAIAYEFTAVPHTYSGQVVPIAEYPDVYEQLLQGQGVQFCPIYSRSQTNGEPEAIFSYPISDDHEVLGSLHLCKTPQAYFDEAEVRIVQQVANQCAIAMRQARLYQAAQAQVQALEALNQLKDDFLSTVSHELRTPVSNMKMAIQMLKIAPSIERRQRYLEILQMECTREIELINDLLDLQRLESQADGIALEETILLLDWLPSVIEPFRSRIQERQQILHMDVPADLPPLISDHANLGRVLVELINNACKYTPAGHQIILSAWCESESLAIAPTPQPVIALRVRNQANIPAAQLDRVFEKFYRVPHADPWQQGGTGLGLALVQKLVEQLQGVLQVESADGWTTFTVHLPTQPQTS